MRTDFGSLGDLLNLRDLPFSTVTAALRGGLDYLRQLEGLNQLSLFNQDLPILGVNLNAALHVADAYAQVLTQLDSNPAAGLGELDELLEDALGTPEDPGGTDPAVPDFSVSTIPELNVGKTFEINGKVIDLADRAAYNPDDVPGDFPTLELFLYSLQRDSDTVEVSLDKSAGDCAAHRSSIRHCFHTCGGSDTDRSRESRAARADRFCRCDGWHPGGT